MACWNHPQEIETVFGGRGGYVRRMMERDRWLALDICVPDPCEG